MALYGPELMRRIASHALGEAVNASWGWRDGFLDHAEHAHSDRPVALHDRAPDSGILTTGHGSIAYQGYGQHFATLDPDTEQDSPDPLEYKFEVRGGRVMLRLYAWHTVAHLNEFYNTRSSAVLVVNRFANNTYYHQITLRVAVRRLADADLPENWVGAKNPDIRFVYDHTKPTNFRVMGDVLVDATDLLCASSRYPEAVTDWKQRFKVLTENSLRLSTKNKALDATITSPNATRLLGPERVADGQKSWGGTQWNPVPDAEGKVYLNFDYAQGAAVARIKIYGYSNTTTLGLHYAPYRWYVEGSADGQTWQPIEVSQCIERCTLDAGGVVVSELSGPTSPVVVDLSLAAPRYKHIRLVFFTHYFDGTDSSWVTVPMAEVEFYEIQ